MKSTAIVKLGRILVWGWVLVFGLFPAAAQTKFIRLRNETIATTPAAALATRAAAAPEAAASGLFLIQFQDGVPSEARVQLQARGVELLHYVPDDAFVARGKSIQIGAVKGLPFVRWAGPYRPEHKVHPALRQAPANAAPAVSVLLAADATEADVAAANLSLTEAQPETRFRFGTILRGRVSSAQLDALAASDKVLWIERAPRMRLHDEVSSRIVAGAGSVPNTTAMMNLGYNGAGVTVAVADSGLDSGDTSSMHPDIQGRVAALFFYGGLADAADEHSHGTHCAGIIAGNGATGEMDENGFLYGLGVAPGASLIAQRMFDGAGNYFPPPTFETLTRDAKRAGADVGSNSWGDDTQGRYDLSAMEFDALVRDADGLRGGDQPYILEFSAGNAGPGTQTIGSPAVAKNVIATGACNSDRLNLPMEEFPIYDTGPDTMADFSSRGPCEDGRIKPDVTAPGTWIASLRSIYANDDNAWWPISDNYLYQGGTSQAGPHVAGAAAVFVQYYRATHGNATPSPALVKAALINSATDMDDSVETEAAPNMDEGWGRVDLPALIASAKDFQFFDQATPLTNGQVFETRIVVAGPDTPLKITLAYTDVPGLPAVIPSLVNDLDLEVVAPDGHVYRGNQFEAGESIPDPSGPDSINNVEGVHFYAPVPGEYIVRVRGSRVVQDARRDTLAVDQDVALVISAVIAPPGLGLVTFDRHVYRAPDLIRLSLVDYNLAGQATATLLLRSTTEPAGETITLRASTSTGVFTGSVATVAGPSLADGKLQVSHGDVIEAVYVDANPPATRIFSVAADLLPPLISNVTATNLYGQIYVTWDTDEDANGVVRYGTNTLTLSVSNRFFDTVHEVELPNVTANRAYKFSIVSEDKAGNRATNDNHGSYFTFTLTASPSVLLVDSYSDYYGFITPPPLEGYTDALNQLGLAYNVFDATGGAVPTLTQLRSYRAVIWRISDLEAPSKPLAQNVSNYLNQGGSLLLASMEGVSRFADANLRSFVTNVLQVKSYTEDMPVDAVTGAPGDAVGSGINIGALDYSAYEEILMLAGTDTPSDWIMPTVNATPILYSGSAVVGIRSPKPGRDLPGRVVYLSFPLDAVALDGGAGETRGDLLRNILNYLAPPPGNSTITLDSDSYTLPSLAVVEVEDIDLEGQGQTTVACHGPHQTNAVTVSLLETVRRGLFRGAVSIMATNNGAPDTLQAQSGDTITVDYLDASSGRTMSATAIIETNPPVIFLVSSEAGYLEAIVSWETSEPADALVQYSESPDTFPNFHTAYDEMTDTDHELYLQGLLPNRTYYFRVVSRDRAGNVAMDDNHGAFYTFTTLDPVRLPWTDDMEHGLGDWTTYMVTDSETNWTWGVPGNGESAHSGQHCWGSNLGGGEASSVECYLFTPGILISGGNRATLRFWHNYDFTPKSDMDLAELGAVEILTDPTGTPVPIQQYEDMSFGWEETEVDLTPYLGQVVYLAWYYGLLSFDNLPRLGWLVDDVSITVDYVAPGTVQITNNIPTAFFALSGPLGTNGAGQWTVIRNAPAGEYVINYGDVAFYDTPPPQTNTLPESGTITFTGRYTLTDSDHDGSPDYAELVAGTDPTNRLSVLKLDPPTIQTGGHLRVDWPAVSGRSYRILGSQDLQTWVPVTDWQPASSNAVSHNLDLPSQGNGRFYRLEVRQ